MVEAPKSQCHWQLFPWLPGSLAQPAWWGQRASSQPGGGDCGAEHRHTVLWHRPPTLASDPAGSGAAAGCAQPRRWGRHLGAAAQIIHSKSRERGRRRLRVTEGTDRPPRAAAGAGGQPSPTGTPGPALPRRGQTPPGCSHSPSVVGVGWSRAATATGFAASTGMGSTKHRQTPQHRDPSSSPAPRALNPPPRSSNGGDGAPRIHLCLGREGNHHHPPLGKLRHPDKPR